VKYSVDGPGLGSTANLLVVKLFLAVVGMVPGIW
jgi:hypothetical protein